MSPFEHVREWIANFNEEAVLWDGFEDAVLGVAERYSQPTLVVYDGDKCVDILRDRGGMSYEEAHEFFSFNTLRCWAGDNTPLILWRTPKEDSDAE